MSARNVFMKNTESIDLFPELSNVQKETNRLLVEIANQIYVSRKVKGKSQKDFANEFHVSQPMICQWESGNYNFSIQSLVEVFDKLDMKINISFLSVGSLLSKPRFGQTISQNKVDRAFCRVRDRDIQGAA